ncbi:hypothetical protein [Longispora fulva]|uniref:hypothetical protein n=1 Tax=Longispora fulva TaxID=619741 RepID=UPI00362EC591
MKRLGSRRLLSDVYGPGAQAGNNGAPDAYVGQLRFDALLAETLVLPDSWILDGRFFLGTAPAVLLDLVGRGAHLRRLPLEVRTRSTARPGGRLADALRANLLPSEGKTTLNPCQQWGISDTGLRTGIAAALGRTPERLLRPRLDRASDLEVPGVLRTFLSELSGGAADEDLGLMETGWRRWIEAERAGVLRVVPWEGRLRIGHPDLSLPAERLVSHEGRELLRRIEDSGSRDLRTSAIARMIAATELPSTDADTLGRWLHAAWHTASARQHHADVAYTVPAGGRALNPLEHALDHDEPDIVLIDDLLPALSALDGAGYGRFTHLHARRLARIWNDGDVGDVRRLVADLTETLTSVRNPRRTGSRAWAAISLAAGSSAVATAPLAAQGPVAVIATTALATVASLSAGVLSYSQQAHGGAGRRRVLRYLRRRAHP